MKMKRISIFLIVLITILVFGMSLAVLAAAEEQPAAQEDTAKKKETQKKKEAAKKDKKDEPVSMHYEMTVTATLTKKDTFEIPKPVSIVNQQKILEKAPNNITDLLPELPGVDVNGVGANQSRPVIRGFRGQRILLLEDGIRMNNSRRQQNFGEIPALVDVSAVERIEIVRGPASVLYGSDAIGGVVNIITKFPDYDLEGAAVHGSLGYRYSSSDSQNKTMANVNGHLGKFVFSLSGNYRKAFDYMAPSGTFGEIDLAQDVEVTDTGVKDGGLNLMLNYNFTKQNHLTFKYEYYHANDAGFGFVEPDLYNPGSARIRIRYPMQEVQKYTFKYQDKELDFVLADHFSFTAYSTTNRRELNMNIFVPFGIPGMPDAGINIGSENYTDVQTIGFRFEFNKGIKNHLFSYGFDFFRDSTENTDNNTNQVVGFGPPVTNTDTTPLVPHAAYRSMGAFFQDDISLFSRTSLILGVRYQNVNAKTKDTPGLEGMPLTDSTDQTVVGAANLIFGVSDKLKLVLSVGRGFRSPNLIERFFNGPTPEGSGFQVRNPGLKAETSLNFDIGFKYRWKSIYLESSYFNNVVYDGIRVAATGGTINGLPEYRDINVDKLRMQGYEILGKFYFNFGVTLSGNYTKIDSKDLANPETPYVDTFSSKFNLNIRYDFPGQLFWMSYDLRVNGEQKDVQLGDNPIGETIPGFSVHSLSGGINLFKNSNFPMRLGIIVGNLTNTLYSEFSNASFFRPAPKRHVVLTWSMLF
ncbi:MAG: TonB-dependent receptor [Candidatus Aminicenantes bacterium]|nr:TonB-dependent receptor [Candidatus Aminicenantes bacterium]